MSDPRITAVGVSSGERAPAVPDIPILSSATAWEFKQSTGLTPHQYVIARRLNRAQVLLATTDLTILEICFRVGFKSQSHFTRLFRKLTGITPRAYRDQ